MSDIPFYQTRLGRDVLQRDLPDLLAVLREIAAELKTLNATLQRSGGEHREPPRPE